MEQGNPANRIAPTPYFRWKSPLDRVLAAILLVPGLPIIGLLVVLVRLTSKGPAIYRQKRVGKDGRPFMMAKIRSMQIGAEAGTGPVWTRVNDPRITRFGRVLRKLHLDELPQLFNVLRGEMSLIGPRPERPEFVAILAESIPNYLDRLVVAPGITGLAQINLEPDTDLESVRRKLQLDCEYIESARLSLDLRMLVCTSLRLVGLKGDLAMSVTGLHRRVPQMNGHAAADVELGLPAGLESPTPMTLVAKGDDSFEARVDLPTPSGSRRSRARKQKETATAGPRRPR